MRARVTHFLQKQATVEVFFPFDGFATPVLAEELQLLWQHGSQRIFANVVWCSGRVGQKKLCVCPDVSTPDICFSHLGLNCQGLPVWTLGVVIMVDALSVFSFPSLSPFVLLL